MHDHHGGEHEQAAEQLQRRQRLPERRRRQPDRDHRLERREDRRRRWAHAREAGEEGEDRADRADERDRPQPAPAGRREREVGPAAHGAHDRERARRPGAHERREREERHAGQHAVAVEDAGRVGERRAELVAGRPAGIVRVAAFQSALLRVVTPAVAALAATQPDVRVEAAEVEVETAVPALRRQQLDAVVGDEYDGQPNPVNRDLAREVLLHEQVRVVLPAGHPPGRPPARAARAPRRRGLGRHAARHGAPGDARPRVPPPRRLRARPALTRPTTS